MLGFAKEYTEKYGIETDINILLENFQTRCTELMEEIISSKITSTRYSQTWINSKVKRLSRLKSDSTGELRKALNVETGGT